MADPFGSLYPKGRSDLDALASTDGVPLSSIGSQPYIAPPRADINAPIDPALVRAHLARTGQVYPPLFQKLNPGAMDAFLARAPESLNVEDWRGIGRDPTRGRGR